MKLKKVMAFALSCAMIVSLVPATAMAAGSTDSKATVRDAASGAYSMDLEAYNGNWSYNETYGCYQLLNVVYCAEPENPAYEALNIYVPEGYVENFQDGTITFASNAKVGNYTADTAPIIYCNGASGWAAKTWEQVTLESLSKRNLELDYKKCIAEGFVLVGAASRGSASKNEEGNYDGKSPNNITDIKAGLRFIKHNDEYLPGNNERIVSAGTSGGGGMSAILGASGNSADYMSYLQEIGAVMDEDDTVFADMCYCPITDLDCADMGYAWMYQNQLSYSSRNFQTGETTTVEFTDFQKQLTKDLAGAYEEYVKGLGLDSRYAEDFDHYAMDLAAMFEASYEKYLKVTYGEDTGKASEDAANYSWLSYDASTGKITINGASGMDKLNAITESGHNGRSKSVPGFDIFDGSLDSRAECHLFGTNGTTDDVGHFSKSLANLLIENKDTYATLDGYSDYSADYQEALTDDMQQRAKMLNPMYYIQDYMNGKNVQPAQYFRLMVGSTDSNTTPTVVFNLGKLLEKAGIDVEYAYIWGQGHGTRDYAGEFEAWVNDICAENELPEGPVTTVLDKDTYLDYSKGIEAGNYAWVLSEDGTYYALGSVDENGDLVMEESTTPMGTKKYVYQGVYTSSNITNPVYQSMMVYVPAAYMQTDAQGNVIGINKEARVGDYTADTAPVVFENNNGAWKSGSPKACDTSYIKEGMIYVSAGSRSRDAMDASGVYHTGKSPMQVVDLKAGVIELRANTDIIPGNMDRIYSVGASGAGQMSSILGASGNMPEYYPYMEEAGVLGVSMEETTGEYVSEYKDNVYAAQCYCPIADIENADLAYAWMRYDSAQNENGSFTATSNPYSDENKRGYQFTEFQLALQYDEAQAFCQYIDDLNLVVNDTKLTFEKNENGSWNPRKGTYYDAVLESMSKALNKLVESDGFDPDTAYENSENWLTRDENGVYAVTDMAGFIEGTGLVRNKDIPGFDTFDQSAENDAFGYDTQDGVHYSASIAKILQKNYDIYKEMAGFDKEAVDCYIDQAWDGEEADYIDYQTNLMNATEILLGSNGLTAVDPAQKWRTRNGTADQHTSFTVAYNLCLAAELAGLDADYSLVWNMGHGSQEGTSTGTFIEWIKGEGVSTVKPSESVVVDEPGTPVNPDKPDNPSNPGISDDPTDQNHNGNDGIADTGNKKNTNTDQSADKKGSTVASKTGDETNMILPIICLAAAGCVAAGVSVGLKRKRI